MPLITFARGHAIKKACFMYPLGYIVFMTYEIETTVQFDKWATGIRDRQAAKAIAKRLDRAITGNFGDCESVSHGISEMRIFVGKGYRLYFVIRNNRIIVLLNGGDK
jgi:putative addiction module killer protein